MSSIAVTYWLPKTSALLFDQVIGIGPDRCPPSFLPDAATLDVISGEPLDIEFRIGSGEVWASVEGENTYHGSDSDAAFRSATQPLLRSVVEDLRDSGYPAYPVYHSQAAHDGEYQPGNYAILVSAFEGLEIVDEEALTWEQVLEFRGDENARKSYGRFIHWLDQALVGKDALFVRDELEQRLDHYYEGYCQVNDIRTAQPIDAFIPLLSGHNLGTRHLLPFPECPRAKLAIVNRSRQMPTQPEQIAYHAINRKKALCLSS